MGRGRAPCCDKIGLKKGPWTPAEDIRLISFIQKYGHGNWRALPKQAGLLRCGKSCRLRWTNYLRPDIKRGNFTIEEEETIIKLHELLGNKWSKIASHLPGRTDNEIKNVWNTHLKKRVISKGPNSSRDEHKESTVTSSSPSSSSNSSTSYSNHDMGRGNEEQTLLIAALDSSCAVDEMVHMEEKQDPLMDIAAIESSVDIWDLLDDRIDHENQNNCKTNFKGNSVSDIDSPSLDVLKELSRSSTSSCSSHSDPVDGSRSEKDQLTLFNNERPCDVYETINEVKKQDILEEMLEIPFEPNFDFWDMIEDEPYFSPSSLVPLCEVETHQHLTIQEYEDEVESKKWVAYLENELGLQTMIDYKQEILTRDAAEPLVPITTTCDDEMMKVEFDPVATYFQI